MLWNILDRRQFRHNVQSKKLRIIIHHCFHYLTAARIGDSKKKDVTIVVLSVKARKVKASKMPLTVGQPNHNNGAIGTLHWFFNSRNQSIVYYWTNNVPAKSKCLHDTIILISASQSEVVYEFRNVLKHVTISVGNINFLPWFRKEICTDVS